MCGLIGVASIRPISERAMLVTGRDALIHRGPDDAGKWWSEDGRVGLGHRRLSILDLSPLGHQPMRDEVNDLTIVLNGEIYNYAELRTELAAAGYRFCSQSDTEVLLAAYVAWGEACLHRLNGMFTFAIYDSHAQQLFLARDRVGEKPLFYHFENGVLQFASELKALLADPQAPRKIDLASLDCYLAMGYVPGERCILQGYKKLPPAHALSFNLQNGASGIWRYWSAPDLGNEEVVDESALLDELEGLLEEAVGRQLIADVPVGILLSGGVDSSLITAMAVRNSSNVRTFSIGFPGSARMDETPHARLIARHFKTEHTELMAEPTTADLIPFLARQFDEPMADSSMIPTWLVSNLVRQHCTVALGGDGGDELFGGYPHYNRLLWLQKNLRFMPGLLRQGVAHGAKKLLPEGFAGSNVRSWLMAAANDFSHDLPFMPSHFDAATRKNLMRGFSGYQSVAATIFRQRTPAQQDLVQRATRMDLENYLAEDILVKVDRASMLNSLEVRAPFLDFRVLEFAFEKVPSRLKVMGHERKILLKRLAAKLLPETFNLKRKQGFSIPLADWLKIGPFRELFWDILNSPDSIFDRATVQKLLERQDQGLNNSERLFALVQFELWRRHYGVTLG